MKKVSLLIVTTSLTIAFGVVADETKGKKLVSAQQLSSQTDSKGGHGAFSCSPQPECGDETNSTWLDLLIQQFTAQSQSENKK